MIRLTDEEIDNLRVDYQDKHLGFDDYLGAIAKAQLKKVVERLNQENTIKLKSLQGTKDWFKHCGLLISDGKWQALLKEVE